MDPVARPSRVLAPLCKIYPAIAFSAARRFCYIASSFGKRVPEWRSSPPSSTRAPTSSAANASLMRELVADLAREDRDGGARRQRGGARQRTSRAASCCRATASTRCSIRARRSSSCRRSPRTACTAATCRRPASSPASAASSGRECVIVANDATVKGGTYYPMTVKKHLRAQEIARENRLPCIYLVDSGGAFLPQQDEVFPDRDHFGRIFYNQATHVRAGHPADRGGDGLVHRRRRLRAGDVATRAIIVQRPGHDLPRRPAAGEGGHRRGGDAPRSWAAATCTRASPAWPTTCAEDDAHALAIARRIVANLNRRQAASARLREPQPSRCYDRRGALRRDPGRHAQALRRARGDRAPRRRLASSTSSSRATAPRWSPASRTSTAIRSASSPTTASCSPSRALKGAHFIELCCAARHPAAVPAEHHRLHGRPQVRAGGIAKDGAKMVTAVAMRQRAEVHGDHRRQLRRRQLRHVRPRLRPALPVDVAERAHLGDGRRAGRVGAGHGAPRRHRGRSGKTWTTEDEEAFKAPIRAQYETQGHPYYATARLWDDGIIDPAQTRAACWAWRCRRRSTRRSAKTRVRRVPDVRRHVQQDPDRQPRRDRLPRHPHRAPPGHRAPSRCISEADAERAPRAPRRRGRADRPAAGARELPAHRAHPRRRAAHRRRGDPSRLRLPVRERGLRRSLRRGGHRLHRPAGRRRSARWAARARPRR